MSVEVAPCCRPSRVSTVLVTVSRSCDDVWVAGTVQRKATTAMIDRVLRPATGRPHDGSHRPVGMAARIRSRSRNCQPRQANWEKTRAMRRRYVVE